MKENPPKHTARRAALFGVIMSIIPAYLVTIECTSVFFTWADFTFEGIISYRLQPVVQFVRSVKESGLAEFIRAVEHYFWFWQIPVAISAIPLFILVIYLLVRFRFLDSENSRFYFTVWRNIRFPRKVVSFIIRAALMAGVVWLTLLYIDNYERHICSTEGVCRMSFFSLDAMMGVFWQVYGVIFWALIHWTMYVFTSFTSASLLYCIGAAENLRGLVRALRTPAVTAVSIAVLIAGVWMLSERYGFGQSVDSVPGYRDYGEEYIMARLSDPPITELYETHNGAILSNVPVLRNYLDDPRGGYAQKKWAVDQLYNIYIEDMDTRNMVRLTYEDTQRFSKNPSYAGPISQVAWYSCDEEYKKIVDTLLAKDIADVEGHYALSLSKIYTKYGDLDEARKWYRHSGQTGSDGRPAAFSVPSSPPFNRGVITGRLLADGEPVKDARVGVMRATKYMLEEDYISYSSSYNIVAGSRTDSDGRFRFHGIVGGDYVLFVRLSQATGYDYKVEGSPGVLTINNDHPAADIGTVDFVTVRAKTEKEQEAEFNAKRERRLKESAGGLAGMYAE